MEFSEFYVNVKANWQSDSSRNHFRVLWNSLSFMLVQNKFCRTRKCNSYTVKSELINLLGKNSHSTIDPIFTSLLPMLQPMQLIQFPLFSIFLNSNSIRKFVEFIHCLTHCCGCFKQLFMCCLNVRLLESVKNVVTGPTAPRRLKVNGFEVINHRTDLNFVEWLKEYY